MVNAEWIERQHVFAHVIGNQAYRQYGIAAFAFCGSGMFNGGCAHGIGEQMIFGLGIGDLEKAKRECREATECSISCFHGLGHGFLVLESYNISRALEDCGGGACIDGIFMEYAWAGPKPNLSQNDPTRFCMSFYGEDARYSCTIYLPVLFTKVFGWEYERTVAECVRAQDPVIRKGCKNSFGIWAVHISRGNLQKILQYCGFFELKDDEYSCLTSAIIEVEYSRFYGWEKTVTTLCKSLPLRMRLGLCMI